MRSRVGTLVAAVIAAVLALLAAQVPNAVAVAHEESLPVHAYDGTRAVDLFDDTATERGPPAAHDRATTYDAVDRRSHGALGRPEIGAGHVHTAYDQLVRPARIASSGTTTQEQAHRADGGLSSPAPTGVAANAVTRAPQVLRVGELKLSAVPRGAVGTPTTTGKGLEYAIPRGTPERSERVASIRIMDPVTTGKHVYPNGYAVYMNAQGQRVNPLTGRMIHDLSDPLAHIPLP